MQHLEIVQDFSRPVADIFEALADHNRLSTVFGIPVSRIRDGKPGVNGIGSIRRIGVKPLAIEETVIALVANKSIDYKISRGGWPLKRHHGRLTFRALPNDRSQVTWHIEFDSALPLAGSVVKTVLGLAISRGLKKLA
ncbi:SRPBCC family protein [Nevskia sp.]|uniref:SRPBCC family protein n=1 Tax=Nevskia sp. TaxID=1929292 RepID=UPI0025D484D2|nr:SRPBCC family protein [Nevskia sp.]